MYTMDCQLKTPWKDPRGEVNRGLRGLSFKDPSDYCKVSSARTTARTSIGQLKSVSVTYFFLFLSENTTNLDSNLARPHGSYFGFTA